MFQVDVLVPSPRVEMSMKALADEITSSSQNVRNQLPSDTATLFQRPKNS
jgi:hypothetical protein